MKKNIPVWLLKLYYEIEVVEGTDTQFFLKESKSSQNNSVIIKQMKISGNHVKLSEDSTVWAFGEIILLW